MKIAVVFLGITLIALGCNEDDKEVEDEFKSQLISRQSAEEYQSLVTEGASKGDKVWFDEAVIRNDTLHLSVHYYGGCEQHTFELVWNGTIRSTIPVHTSFAVIHDANNDQCRELVYETLSFGLPEISFPRGQRSIAATVFSAESPYYSVKAGFFNPPQGFHYDFGFEETNECSVEAVARNYSCMIDGKNLVILELNDSVSYDRVNYFKKYLLATQTIENKQDFRLEAGKKYLVGGTIMDSDYLDWFGCSDPVPMHIVRVNCITEIAQ